MLSTTFKQPLSKFVNVTFNPNNETGASSIWMKIFLEVGHVFWRTEKTRDYEQRNSCGQMLLTYLFCVSRGDERDSQTSLFFLITEQELE